MKFDDIDNKDWFEYTEFIKKRPSKCICGKTTHWFNVLYASYVCSTECEEKLEILMDKN